VFENYKVEENILTHEQIDKIVRAFFQGRSAQHGAAPTETECASLLQWFNEIARGVMLLQLVLDEELILNMNDNVIAFISNPECQRLSQSIMEQIESLDKHDDNGV